MMDYKTLKRLAKTLKRPVVSLVGLASYNDPFYCGAPFQVTQAKWFADLWEQFKYTSGVHLRHMHYQIISQSPPIKLVNGCHTKTHWHVGMI
jgi:hypothetical protein